jgi:hypothetical protein
MDVDDGEDDRISMSWLPDDERDLVSDNADDDDSDDDRRLLLLPSLRRACDGELS